MSLENFENFSRIAIIGLGFMGIALAKALKSHNNVFIGGFDLNKDLLELLLKKNVIDRVFENLEELADESDIIFLTTPVDTFKNIISQMTNHLNRQILVDFGSVKCTPFRIINELIEDKSVYVPAHPICGGRSINIENNLEDEVNRIEENIFENHLIHFFPKNSSFTSMKIIEDIFIDFGAKINKDLGLRNHDKIYALTSHLPMFLAVNMFSVCKLNIYSYFKNKLQDKMWYSIFTENVDNLAFWSQKINKDLRGKEFISAFDLSCTLKNIVHVNGLEKYTGAGYLMFMAEKCKENCCKLNDFIENQDKLLSIHKNGDFKYFINFKEN